MYLRSAAVQKACSAILQTYTSTNALDLLLCTEGNNNNYYCSVLQGHHHTYWFNSFRYQRNISVIIFLSSVTFRGEQNLRLSWQPPSWVDRGCIQMLWNPFLELSSESLKEGGFKGLKSHWRKDVAIADILDSVRALEKKKGPKESFIFFFVLTCIRNNIQAGSQPN